MATYDPHRHGSRIDEPELTAPVTPRVAPVAAPAVSDVVFDFAGRQATDFRGLTMILTARQVAEKGRVTVWLKDVPDRTWALLRALGVDRLFERFPEPSAHPN
jgi:hypothetical protein